MGIRLNSAVALLALLAALGIRPTADAASSAADAAASAARPAATGMGSQAVTPGAPGEVLARVNGSPITRAEAERVVRVFIAQNRASHDITPEVQKEAEEAALEQLIGSRLLYEMGRALEIKELERQVEERIAQARKKFPSEEAYLAALQANGLSEAEAQQMVRTDLVVTAVLDREVIGKISIPEREIRKFYDDNQEKFTAPAQVHLRHILIGVEAAATPETREQARHKAEELRHKLVEGADFAALARSESSCPSKDEGGDLGSFNSDELLPAFEKATAQLKPGEISTIAQTQFGFHVLMLVERSDAKVTSFEAAREKIEYYLKQKRIEQAIPEYVATLKSKAKIDRSAGT